ncbi:choline-binding protein D, partial [Faecalimonas umbilicata]|nr:choline-binding protein D [Faecalimonas umbilicata]
GSGAMKTGWYQVSGKWYYSYSSGALAVNTTIDGYTVNANGEWV